MIKTNLNRIPVLQRFQVEMCMGRAVCGPRGPARRGPRSGPGRGLPRAGPSFGGPHFWTFSATTFSRLQHNNCVYNSNLAHDSQNTERIRKHKFYNQCRSCTVSDKYGRACHNKYIFSQPPTNEIHIELRIQTSKMQKFCFGTTLQSFCYYTDKPMV